MKVIIIGTSLSGKTNLIRYLRNSVDFPILEIDEELTRINGGKYPTDNNHKHNTLAPRIIKDVLGRNNVVFFTNTDYFAPNDLKRARENGFKIVQLFLDLEQLEKRNISRVKEDGYSDLSEWLGGMVEYQKKIVQLGLVDHVIDANQPTEKIASELLLLTN